MGTLRSPIQFGKERTEKEREKGLDPVPPLRGGSVFFLIQKKASKYCVQKGVTIANFFLAVFLLRRTGAAVDEVDGAPR